MASDTHFFAGLAMDVSRGGVFVATYRMLPVGSRVALTIALLDGQVEVSGLVRWRREAPDGGTPGLGVAFESLDDDAGPRITAFCAARPPLLYDLDDEPGCTSASACATDPRRQR